MFKRDLFLVNESNRENCVLRTFLYWNRDDAEKKLKSIAKESSLKTKRLSKDNFDAYFLQMQHFFNRKVYENNAILEYEPVGDTIKHYKLIYEDVNIKNELETNIKNFYITKMTINTSSYHINNLYSYHRLDVYRSRKDLMFFENENESIRMLNNNLTKERNNFDMLDNSSVKSLMQNNFPKENIIKIENGNVYVDTTNKENILVDVKSFYKSSRINSPHKKLKHAQHIISCYDVL